MYRRSLLLTALAASALTGLPALPAHAKEKQPLTIIVGFPPGGSADTISRLVADGLRNDFSPVVVENRPGAAGRIAIRALMHAKADGRTVIIMPNGPMVLFPYIYRKLDYDPVKDFTPVSLLARFQFGVVAGPGSGAKTVSEMIAQVKADPRTGTYGSPGQGTLPHLLGVMFSHTTGVPLQHIPFQGGGPANNALLGGVINYKFDVVSETAPFHRAGKVHILAVMGDKRDPQVPDVPTLKEAGVDMQADGWFAMYAPAGLAAPEQATLEQAVARALHDPRMREKVSSAGFEPVGSTASELASAQAADLRRWAVVKSAGVLLD